MKSKQKSREFIVKFVKFMANTVSGGSYVVSELIDGLVSISYKGVRYRKHPYYRGIQNLKKRGFVIERQGRISMTSQGQRWLSGAYLRYAQKTYPKWDKKWRVVIFDIPQELHNARNLFRNRLKKLGFITIQKSIFVFPYPCEEDLGDVCKNYKIEDYVDVIIADSLGSQQGGMKEHFNL
jgi:DNA-binding transcriptional regulator PaaX